MDEDVATGELDELAERNVGFRFLYNKDQAQSSAMLFLQWCLAPQVVQRLKDAGVADARVFVTVTNPHGRETRHVFPLVSPQELVEFHCPGTHIISGTVVYCPNQDSRDAKKDLERSTKNFLEKGSRYSYEYELERVIRAGDCESFGEAYLSVEIADGFFAPQMSAREDWWVNLWFGEPAWDQCEIRRRRMIAYTVQPLLVAAWVSILFLIRLCAAFVAGVLELRKNVPWNVLVHPFSAKTADIRNDSTVRWTGRPFANLLIPINQLGFFGLAIIFSIPTAVMTGWLLGMSIVFSYVLLMGAIIAAIGIPRWLDKLPQAEPKRIDLDQLYSDLLCTTVPPDGTLRAKRRGLANNLVLRFHDFKASVCKPTARG